MFDDDLKPIDLRMCYRLPVVCGPGVNASTIDYIDLIDRSTVLGFFDVRVCANIINDLNTNDSEKALIIKTIEAIRRITCPKCGSSTCDVERRRMSTQYVDEESNYLISCISCFDEYEEHWAEQWAAIEYF